MRRLPTFLFIFVGVSTLSPGSPFGDSRLYGQAEPGCPTACTLLVPLVPFLPGPSCLTLEARPGPLAVYPAEPCDPPTPVVKIRVRVPACGAPGEPIEYRIRISNESPADAHHVVVKNVLPANARLLRASPE